MTAPGPSMIVSFGFRHGLVIDGVPVRDMQPKHRHIHRLIGPNLVIDVRHYLPYNPHHNRAIRPLRGTDPIVQAEIRRLTPDLDAVLLELTALVAGHAGPVYVGCTGGHHRSVFVADMIGQTLGIPVVHKDFDTP